MGSDSERLRKLEAEFNEEFEAEKSKNADEKSSIDKLIDEAKDDIENDDVISIVSSGDHINNIDLESEKNIKTPKQPLNKIKKAKKPKKPEREEIEESTPKENPQKIELEKTRKEILKNVRDDRDGIEELISNLWGMVEDNPKPSAALIESVTNAHRIKMDQNNQLIKVYELDSKQHAKEIEKIDEDDFLDDIMD